MTMPKLTATPEDDSSLPEKRSLKLPKRKPKIEKVAKSKNSEDALNPVWFKPVMFGFMIVGLFWIITYYVTSAQFPLGAATPLNLSNWNILIGFGIAMVGFLMSTRWK
jgi:Cell division protein CrgA